MANLIYYIDKEQVYTQKIDDSIDKIKVGKNDQCHHVLPGNEKIKNLHFILHHEGRYEIYPLGPCQIAGKVLPIKEWFPLGYDQPCYLNHKCYIMLESDGDTDRISTHNIRNFSAFLTEHGIANVDFDKKTSPEAAPEEKGNLLENAFSQDDTSSKPPLQKSPPPKKRVSKEVPTPPKKKVSKKISPPAVPQSTIPSEKEIQAKYDQKRERIEEAFQKKENRWWKSPYLWIGAILLILFQVLTSNPSEEIQIETEPQLSFAQKKFLELEEHLKKTQNQEKGWETAIQEAQDYCKQFPDSEESAKVKVYIAKMFQNQEEKKAKKDYDDIFNQLKPFLEKNDFQKAYEILNLAEQNKNLKSKQKEIHQQKQDIQTLAQASFEKLLKESEQMVKEGDLLGALTLLQAEHERQLESNHLPLEKKISAVQTLQKKSKLFWQFCELQDNLYALLKKREFSQAQEKVQEYASQFENPTPFIKDYQSDIQIVQKCDNLFWKTLEQKIKGKTFKLYLKSRKTVSGKIATVSSKKQSLILFDPKKRATTNYTIADLSWKTRKQIFSIGMDLKKELNRIDLALYLLVHTRLLDAAEQLEGLSPQKSNIIKEKIARTVINLVRHYAQESDYEKLQSIMANLRNCGQSETFQTLQEQLAMKLWNLAQKSEKREQRTFLYQSIINYFTYSAGAEKVRALIQKGDF